MSDVTQSLHSYIEILRDTMPHQISLDAHSPLISQSPSAFARCIDHTCLAPTATLADVDRACAEAREYVFASICVRPEHVAAAAANLAPYNTRCVRDEDSIGITSVVGFPSGTTATTEKAAEADAAVARGATELDMVINYPLLIAGKYKDVFEDIAAVRDAANAAARMRVRSRVTGTGTSTAQEPPPHAPFAPAGAGAGAAAATVSASKATSAAAEPAQDILEPMIPLKVILETSALTRDEIIAGTAIATFAGAKWVKTSTGFRGRGASAEDVATMRAVCEAAAHGTKVKASGGVRSAADCIRLIRAGAERIGTSGGAAIMQEVSGPEFVIGGIGVQ